jgi:hypothetical protein
VTVHGKGRSRPIACLGEEIRQPFGSPAKTGNNKKTGNFFLSEAITLLARAGVLPDTTPRVLKRALPATKQFRNAF